MTHDPLNGNNFTTKEMIKMILDDNIRTRVLIEEIHNELDSKVSRTELWVTISGLMACVSFVYLALGY
jgi:hypothetical protein